jgi:DNA-binding transcriptional LysR family regulator
MLFIQPMNIKDIDLNLLVVFDSVMRERNITLAARRLGLSQPALSNALSRLRRTLGDPLFVRTGHGMEPTPYAERLAGPIRQARGLIDDALSVRTAFEPAKSNRIFTFYMTDIGEVVMLPSILRYLQKEAPQIGVKVLRIPQFGVHEAMATGEVDLAVGLFPTLQTSFFEQALYRDNFVCIARRDHPSIGSSITEKQFSTIPHILVASTGTGHDVIIEHVMAEQQVKRSVALTVPDFIVLPTIVGQTDLIVTIPARAARSFPNPNIKSLKPPIEFPDIEVKQHWHERFHHDPANKWMRNVIARLFKA